MPSTARRASSPTAASSASDLGTPAIPDLRTTVIGSWRTNNRVTIYLIEQLPPKLWPALVPGVPHRTIRMIAAHLHNARCSWIRTLGAEHGVPTPVRVDHRTVSRRHLVTALRRSGRGIEALLRLGLGRGGEVPPSRGYVWRNLPLDVGHVLTYFVAHEAHHRGQLIMVARQVGLRLEPAIAGGVWQWTTRSREA